MTQLKTTRVAVPALLALALAACQQPANDSNIAIDNGVNAANVVESVPPNDSTSAAQGTPSAIPPASTSPLPTQIPQPFVGRWGLVPADCTSTRGDAKGLLTIAADGLTFYESRGTISRVIAAGAERFDARFAFAGEGQTWKRTERFKLAGNQLNRRTDAEPGQEPPVNLTYARCGD